MPQGSTGFVCPTIGRLFRSSATPPADPPVLEVALAIYHGGKVDGLPGMEAVAHVIQNRTSDPAFGGDPRSVVASGTEQFVDVKQALPTPRNATEKRLFGLARRMATQLVRPPQRLSFPDPTGGAVYYDRRKPATQHGVNRPSGTGTSSTTQGAGAVAAEVSASAGNGSGGGPSSMQRGAGSDSSGSLVSGEISESESQSVGGTRFTPPLASPQPVQPSRGRRPLAFFLDRRPPAEAPPPPTPAQRATAASSSREPASINASAAREGVASARQASAASRSISPRTPPPPMGAASSSATPSVVTTPPPTPPPPSPLPHFASLPLGNSVGSAAAAARLPATRPMLPRGFVAAQPPSRSRGPVDVDGYHDMVLPCGLFQDEVIEIMYRDLSPEDFETLCKLDEKLPKRNTAQRSIVDRLPRALARDCGATECRVCLAEFEPTCPVVKLPCRHAFHKACISKWLTQCKNTCPLCFTPIQLQTAPPAPASTGNTAAAAQSTLRTV